MAFEPKPKHAKKQKFWKNPKFLPTALGLFIITIMITSVLGLWTEQNEESYNYKGIKFTRTDYGWIGYKDSKPIYLSTNPKELENITIGYIPVYDLNKLSKIYISLDYTENIQRAIQEFEQNIHLSPKLVPACYKDSAKCASNPLKTCEDATDLVGVILFKESNETEVSLINNCLTIQGKELTKIVDKLTLNQL